MSISAISYHSERRAAKPKGQAEAAQQSIHTKPRYIRGRTPLRNLHAGSPGCAPRRRRALQHAEPESLRVCCLSACAVCTALQRAPPQPLLRSNPAPPRRAAAAAHLGAAHPFSLALPPPRQPPPTLATGAPAAAPRPRDAAVAAAQAARACSSACCTSLTRARSMGAYVDPHRGAAGRASPPRASVVCRSGQSIDRVRLLQGMRGGGRAAAHLRPRVSTSTP